MSVVHTRGHARARGAALDWISVDLRKRRKKREKKPSFRFRELYTGRYTLTSAKALAATCGTREYGGVMFPAVIRAERGAKSKNAARFGMSHWALGL